MCIIYNWGIPPKAEKLPPTETAKISKRCQTVANDFHIIIVYRCQPYEINIYDFIYPPIRHQPTHEEDIFKFIF